MKKLFVIVAVALLSACGSSDYSSMPTTANGIVATKPTIKLKINCSKCYAAQFTLKGLDSTETPAYTCSAMSAANFRNGGLDFALASFTDLDQLVITVDEGGNNLIVTDAIFWDYNGQPIEGSVEIAVAN